MAIGKKSFGNRAEQAAIGYLKSMGYSICATRWRESRYEIDIIASKGSLLVFVEVKASRRDTLGPPELRVNREKRKRLVQAASEYVSRLRDIPEDIRFDVIGVLWKEGQPPEFNHMESAFTADDD